jgi:hypothetical protein
MFGCIISYFYPETPRKHIIKIRRHIERQTSKYSKQSKYIDYSADNFGICTESDGIRYRYEAKTTDIGDKKILVLSPIQVFNDIHTLKFTDWMFDYITIDGKMYSDKKTHCLRTLKSFPPNDIKFLIQGFNYYGKTSVISRGKKWTITFERRRSIIYGQYCLHWNDKTQENMHKTKCYTDVTVFF